nr:Hypothetical protein [Aeromonas sp.]
MDQAAFRSLQDHNADPFNIYDECLARQALHQLWLVVPEGTCRRPNRSSNSFVLLAVFLHFGQVWESSIVPDITVSLLA